MKQSELLILLLMVFAMSIAGAYYLGTRNVTTSSSVPVKSDQLYKDSVAILSAREDTLRQRAEILLRNIENENKIKLAQQRKFYEDRINHIITLSADSTLRLFTDYTSQPRRYIGSDSD